MRTLTKTGAVCLMAATAITCVFANPEEDNKKSAPQRANVIGEIIEEAKLGDNDYITYEQFTAARDAVMKKKQEQAKVEREKRQVEREKRQKERFMAMDKDKDGKISKAELLEMQKKMIQRRRSEGMEKSDADGKGRGGAQQHRGMRKPGQNQQDADKDGKVSPEELRAARKARAGQQGERPARGERGGRKPAPQTDDKE